MNIFLKLFALATLLAFVMATITAATKRLCRVRQGTLWAAIILGTTALLTRWWLAGQLELTTLGQQGLLEPGWWPWLKTMASHPPCTNLFEVLISLSWALVITALLLEKRYNINLFAPLATGMALMGQGAAFWALDATIDPLAPVLRSWWLHLHVAVAAFSYAAALAAAAVAFLYLLKDRIPRWQLWVVSSLLTISGLIAFLYGREPWNLIFLIAALCVTAVFVISAIAYDKITALPISAPKLDALSGRLVTVTFITLTLVLVTGSIWAHYSWGRFWSWDPKETWSLVAWLCYGCYLELRLHRHLEGKPLAYLALFAIIVVLFAFLGVNLGLTGPGMHSYGRG